MLTRPSAVAQLWPPTQFVQRLNEVGMRLFAYGTLMDRDILRLVTGRELGDRAAAMLKGWVPARVQGASYPVLRRAPRASTKGVLLVVPDRKAARALEQYEGPYYRATPVLVTTTDGQECDAVTFMGVPGRLRSEPVVWSLETWRRREKAVFLRSTFGRQRRA